MAAHGEARAMQSDKPAAWLAPFGISYRPFLRKANLLDPAQYA
jgi:hypothetical protein